MNLKLASILSGTALALAATAGEMPAPATAQAVPVPAADTNETNATNVAKVPGAQFTNSVGMELVRISGGFWAGKFEVTQKEYQKVTGSNPSAFSGDNKLPVDSVSWNDAVEFCRKLTEMDIKEKKLPEGYRYTLPTEDEWQSFAASASLEDAITSLGASRSGTSPVGSRGANALGLCDVLGNVMEFCLSDTSQPYRILHGGSWQDFTEINLRPAFRYYCQPDERKNTFGFRCVLKAGPGAAGN